MYLLGKSRSLLMALNASTLLTVNTITPHIASACFCRTRSRSQTSKVLLAVPVYILKTLNLVYCTQCFVILLWKLATSNSVICCYRLKINPRYSIFWFVHPYLKTKFVTEEDKADVSVHLACCPVFSTYAHSLCMSHDGRADFAFNIHYCIRVDGPENIYFL